MFGLHLFDFRPQCSFFSSPLFFLEGRSRRTEYDPIQRFHTSIHGRNPFFADVGYDCMLAGSKHRADLAQKVRIDARDKNVADTPRDSSRASADREADRATQ